MWHSGRPHTSGLELNPHHRKQGWERRQANGGGLGKSEAATRHMPVTLGPPKEESITEGSSRYYSAANILILGFWIQEIDDEVFSLSPQLVAICLSRHRKLTYRTVFNYP